MESAQVSKDMVTCELEAAEILACLAQYSAAGSGEFERPTHQPVTEPVISSSGNTQPGQAITAQLYRGHTNERARETVPSEHLCSTSYKTNLVGKLRPKLTEAEKEARKLRRILANRESARQTIRSRQAMYVDLTRKAADLSEENVNLKEQKELAVKEYKSLKDRNDFLKAEMAKIKKGDTGENTQEDPTTTPINQPSLVPYIWPSMFPYADFLQFQYASHSNNITNSSQFSRPEIPFVVVPVPWLLPYLPVGPHSETNDARIALQSSTSCSSSVTLMNGDNNMRAEASNSTKAMRESGGQYTRYRPTCYNTTCDANFVSGCESVRNIHRLHKSREAINISSPRKPEDILAAVEARRRRKELMKLKNINEHHN